MEIEQIIKLVNTVSSSTLSEFTYNENGVDITMKKNGTVVEKKICVNEQRIEKVENSEEKTDVPEGNMVLSPLVGTFYSAPSEDAEPFVKIGDKVTKGQTLAIVEAMKLMNEIECEYDGTIGKILVKNGDPVEYGQPLFSII